MRKLILPLLLTLLPTTWAFAQDTNADEALSEDQIVERILDLQRQIDELVAALSPEARERLARRLAAAAPQPAPNAPPPPAAPEVAVESPAAPEVAVESVPTPAPEPPAAAPAAAPEPQPLRRRLTRGPHCNFLEFLDSNQDGKISSSDRYWRHLYLWSDANGDRQVQEQEVESAYDLEVREIAVDLGVFLFKKGHIGEMRVEGFVTLDVRGDGLGGTYDRILVVDATKLGRGSGPRISSADGEALAGFQPFQPGWRIEQDGGQMTVLECP